MTAKVPPAAGRAGLACHLELDRNPLRRRTDWPEPTIMAGPIAVFLAGAPLAAIGVGGRAHSIGVREQCAEQSWHQVSVVLLQGVPRHAAFRHWFQLARVWAQWMPPGESMRAAEVWLAACETAWKSAGPHWTTRSLAGADSCPFAACGPWKSPFSGSWRGTVGRVRSGAGLAGNMAGRCCREGVRTVPGCRGSAFPAARLPEGVTGLPGSATIADGCSR